MEWVLELLYERLWYLGPNSHTVLESWPAVVNYSLFPSTVFHSIRKATLWKVPSSPHTAESSYAKVLKGKHVLYPSGLCTASSGLDLWRILTLSTYNMETVFYPWWSIGASSVFLILPVHFIRHTLHTHGSDDAMVSSDTKDECGCEAP